ncbi:hypothetical protein [Methylobacterium sp. 10]|uniref:hypothetical protein n=1 Tax=Methylobacterium sp. 10 TaxID=1101191 RepID=UPI0009DD9548|nr:hypothetical protein [Methylobacterium sp. 10]
MIASADEFIRLRNSEIPEEYERAASEPAPHEVWLELVANHPEMRFWVAYNKSVPISILEILADDADERVRFMVASKRKLSPELFLKMSSDVDCGVRARIACNKKTPRFIIERLCLDNVELVAEAARGRLIEFPDGTKQMN